MGEEEIMCKSVMHTLGVLLSLQPEETMTHTQKLKSLRLLAEDFDEDESEGMISERQPEQIQP